MRAPRSRGLSTSRGRFAPRSLDAFLGERLHHRIGVGAVERFHRVRHRVHAACRRNLDRQIEREFRIVDRGCRQRLGAIAGDAVFGDADIPARRHFRAGIGGDDGNVTKLGHRGRGLGETDRRAAADHDEAVGVDALELGEDVLEGFARHGLSAGVAEAQAALRDRRDHAAGEFGPRLRAQHQKPRHFVQIGFGAERGGGARAEDDAHRVGVVGELVCHRPFLACRLRRVTMRHGRRMSRHPEVRASRASQVGCCRLDHQLCEIGQARFRWDARPQRLGRLPNEIGICRFRILAVQVGKSRLEWAATRPPQDDGEQASQRIPATHPRPSFANVAAVEVRREVAR